MDTPPVQSSSQTPTEARSALRSQVRSLKRELRERTQRPFPDSPLDVDIQATDLALRSSQLVLEATSMCKAATRAANRKGRDARKLVRQSA